MENKQILAQEYVGTKRVYAQPMTRGAYNTLRGWQVPADENPADTGYLVEYTDGGKANHPNFKGYISWSPADVFERAYKAIQQDPIEQEIQAKGLTAPRVTPGDIEANIVTALYFTGAEGAHQGLRQQDHTEAEDAAIRGPLQLLTFCVLVLQNGFTVTGESACASPENFDAEVGRKIARANAINKVWPLMGYALKQRLFDRPAIQKSAE